jgi:hypothetical protein
MKWNHSVCDKQEMQLVINLNIRIAELMGNLVKRNFSVCFFPELTELLRQLYPSAHDHPDINMILNTLAFSYRFHKSGTEPRFELDLCEYNSRHHLLELLISFHLFSQNTPFNRFCGELIERIMDTFIAEKTLPSTYLFNLRRTDLTRFFLEPRVFQLFLKMADAENKLPFQKLFLAYIHSWNRSDFHSPDINWEIIRYSIHKIRYSLARLEDPQIIDFQLKSILLKFAGYGPLLNKIKQDIIHHILTEKSLLQ